MTFDEYQKQTAFTAIYPEAGEETLTAIQYCTLGLCGETGEAGNCVKKLLRDGDTPEKRKALSKELGDALWYLSQLCTELDTRLSDLAIENLAKLADRKERGVLQGNGDYR
jgi:NTP pyrophosphatase (non-canonical NTP hydrolase)